MIPNDTLDFHDTVCLIPLVFREQRGGGGIFVTLSESILQKGLEFLPKI